MTNEFHQPASEPARRTIPPHSRRPLRVAATATILTLVLAGCSHLTTNVGSPLPPSEKLRLAVGTCTVGDVLRAMGPPAGMSAAGGGLAMIYEHSIVNERQLGFSVPYNFYKYLKLVVADATLDHDCRVLTFDSRGVLTGWSEERRDTHFGSGFAVQPLVSARGLVDTSELSEAATQHSWGRACLDALPQTLNVAQSLTDGSHGLEQSLAPLYAGQHALEMTSEEGFAEEE